MIFWNVLIFLVLYCIWSIGTEAEQSSWSVRELLPWATREISPPKPSCPKGVDSQPCGEAVRGADKRACYRAGCCFDKSRKRCVMPKPFPGRTTCVAGCGFVRIVRGGLSLVENANKPYTNKESAVLHVIGPSSVLVEEISVESPEKCAFDFLTIGAKRICTPQKIVLPKGKNVIIWTTDSYTTAKGFKLKVTPIAQDDAEMETILKLIKTERGETREEEGDGENGAEEPHGAPLSSGRRSVKLGDAVPAPTAARSAQTPESTSLAPSKTEENKTVSSEQGAAVTEGDLEKLRAEKGGAEKGGNHDETAPGSTEPSSKRGAGQVLSKTIQNKAKAFKSQNAAVGTAIAAGTVLGGAAAALSQKTRSEVPAIIVMPSPNPSFPSGENKDEKSRNNGVHTVEPTAEKSISTKTLLLSGAGVSAGVILVVGGLWCLRRHRNQEDPLAGFATDYDYNTRAGIPVFPPRQ